MILIATGISIDERDLHERFVRASGPGGQNVNKVATAVELRFNIATSAIPEDVKERLRALAANRISADDVLLIDSRENRSQLENREAARQRLIELLKRAAVKPKQRRPTRPKRSASEKRLETKKQRGVIKSLRRQGSSD